MNKQQPMTDSERACENELSGQVEASLEEARKNWPTREELGCPTDEEVQLIIARASPTAQRLFKDSVRRLYFAKWGSGSDTRPWRELVAVYLNGESIEGAVIDEDGSRRTQVMHFANGYLNNRISAAACSLVQALEAIESEIQKKTEVATDSANARHRPINQLKEWARQHARSSSRDEARRLCMCMPEEIKRLAARLKDPERTIYEALRGR